MASAPPAIPAPRASQPDLVPHDLHHDDPVMAVRRAVQAVDGLRRDAERRVETKGHVGQSHVVVDRLRQRDDVQAFLRQPVGVLLCPAAAQTHQHVEVVFVVVVHDDVGHIDDLPADGHAMRLVAAGTQDRAALGQNAREHVAVELHGAVLHEPAETVAKPDHLHAVETERCLAHPANRRVQAGAIASRCENADVLGHTADTSLLTPPSRPSVPQPRENDDAHHTIARVSRPVPQMP